MHPSLPWLPWLLQDDGQQLSRVCGLLAAAEGGTALEKDLKVRPWLGASGWCGWVRVGVGGWVRVVGEGSQGATLGAREVRVGARGCLVWGGGLGSTSQLAAAHLPTAPAPA